MRVYKPALLFFLTILFVFLIYLSPRFILTHKFPKGFRNLISYFYPPDDFYDQRATHELNPSKGDLTLRFEYSNKYLGRYFVGLISEKFGSDWYFDNKSRKLVALQLAINFYVEGEKLSSRVVGADDISPFMNGNMGGMHLLVYDCPTDLPEGKTITCEVEVIQPDQKLEKKFGPMSFFIEKGTDY